MKPSSQVSADIEITQLSEHVWLHTSHQEMERWGRVPANGLLVKDQNDVVMVDTPWNDEQTRELCDWIKTNWGADVKTVIPTHYHEDCMGGLAELHRRGAASISNALTAALAKESELPVPQKSFEGETAVKCGGLDLILFYPGAGHTVDNFVVYVSSGPVLFGGCLVKPENARGMGNTDNADVSAWPASIQKTLERFPNAKIVVPGHGAPGTLDHLRHTIQLCQEHLRQQ